MALLGAKCTNCGAALKIDGAFESACCAFCGAQLDVGNAVRYHFTSLQAPPPAAPQASATKNWAKTAFVCGLASCAGALLSVVASSASDLFSYGSFGRKGVSFLAILFAGFGIFLAIASFACGKIAGKESNAQKNSMASASVVCSVLGTVISFFVIVIN